MAFGVGKNLAVLESKFEIYEDVSKEMLDKLDRAVNAISENSNKVAIILERHEAKLNDSAKTDQVIIKMMEDLKKTSKGDTEIIQGRITIIENRVQELSKFRWLVVGVATAAVIVIKSADLFGPILNLQNNSLTNQSKSDIVYRERLTSNVLY
jgi:DNA polymerase II small subunit/DNA polymerase delta subunit B